MSLRIFTIAFSCTSICSAYEDRSRNCQIGVPFCESRGASVGPRRRPCLRAQRRPARETELAAAAEHRQAGDHVVARRDVVHVGADLLDDARRLVTEHGRHRVQCTRRSGSAGRSGTRPRRRCGSSTSRGPGFEIWMSSIVSGCFTARSTAAFMRSLPGRAGARAAILELCAPGQPTAGRLECRAVSSRERDPAAAPAASEARHRARPRRLGRRRSARPVQPRERLLRGRARRAGRAAAHALPRDRLRLARPRRLRQAGAARAVRWEEFARDLSRARGGAGRGARRADASRSASATASAAPA